MCNETNLAEWAARTALTRRQFGAAGALSAAAACTPIAGDTRTPAATGSIAMRKVEFSTPDGTLDGEFYADASSPAPGIIFWPDIAGIRPANRQMAQRLAEAGYAVLLANPYYRSVKGQQFSDFADFAGNDGFKKVGPWREKLSVQGMMTDHRAAADWLMKQDAVDTARGMASQGYCMTGSAGIVGPAAAPEIRAGCSFHGGGLVSDKPDSPHTLFKDGKHYLVAIAENDDAKSPGDKTVLKEAAAKAGADAEIEVYPADHGWTVPDSPSYDAPAAERAWSRMLAIYKSAL